MAYNLQKLLIGSFIYFVESGETVDAIVIGNDAYPDTDPVENWNNIGCVSEASPTTKTETDTDWCPSAAGGYYQDDDETVVQDIIEFKTRSHSEPIWRMILGVKNKIVDGTAQTPFGKPRRSIEGWLKVQLRAQDGADRVVMNVYGKLSLKEAPKWSKDPTKPSLKFAVIPSPIATMEPNGIA